MKWLYKMIWKYFKDGLIDYYTSSQNNPIHLSELEYRFTDSKGRKYYGFTSHMVLPLSRFGKLREYLIWLSNGLTQDTLTQLIEIAETEIEKGVNNISQKKNAGLVKIGAIMHEIKTRKDIIRPLELIYNVGAVQLIREDENPNTFNQKIHQEKVEQMMEEEENGNYFFFQLTELNKLLNFATMSETELTTYMRESNRELSQLREKIRLLKSSA